MSADLLLAPSARRRRTDVAMRTLLGLMTAIALVPLVFVVYYLLKRGLGAWSKHFFTTDPTGNFLGDPGGIRSAAHGSCSTSSRASASRTKISSREGSRG